MRTRLVAPLLVILLAACEKPVEPEVVAPPATPAALARIEQAPHDLAVIDLGELGTLRIELLPELAPLTVARFIELAEQGFYDGTTFHRVIPGFMIQGGDPLTKNVDPRDDGNGNSGQRLPDEFTDYPHLRGTVSMANSGRSNTSDSQFFVVQQDNRELDGDYTVFGRVVDGIETVDAVTQLEIDVYGRFGPRDRPYPKKAAVQSLRIERAAPRPSQTTGLSSAAVAR
jgi:cyclophilin family peptidyl-prolyl cis-trans isomerase